MSRKERVSKMKDYIFRTISKFKNRQYLFLIYGVVILLIIWSGFFAPLILITTFFIIHTLGVRSQVEYIVPRTEIEMKNEAIGKIVGGIVFSAIVLGVSLWFTQVVCKNTIIAIFGVDSLMLNVVYYIGIVCVIFSLSVSDEMTDYKGKKYKAMKLIEKIELFLRIVIGGSYAIIGLDWAEKWVSKNELLIVGVLLLLSLILVIAELYRIKKWRIGDYSDR